MRFKTPDGIENWMCRDHEGKFFTLPVEDERMPPENVVLFDNSREAEEIMKEFIDIEIERTEKGDEV